MANIPSSRPVFVGPATAVYNALKNKTDMGIDPQMERFAQGFIMHMCRNSAYSGIKPKNPHDLFSGSKPPLSVQDLELTILNLS